MRFVFVDRIVALDPGRAIETLKNVTATEDVFDDHFPGCPLLPGALVIEAFEQATQLLIAMTFDFACVGRLRWIRRAAFRHFVRPGDQLRLRCERRPAGAEEWTVDAAARVDGRVVATAGLELDIEAAASHPDAARRADRLRALATVLQREPLDHLRGRIAW